MIMKKLAKAKRQPRPVSDKIKEAHHGVIVATASEEIAGATWLIPDLNNAIETRDYRKVVDLTRQIASHYNRIERATTSAMVQLGYDGMLGLAERDDDDDDDM